MDINKLRKTIGTILDKYKYALLIFLIGFVLMIIPGNKQQNEVSTEVPHNSDISVNIEKQLEEILSYVQGAGNVKVMLKQITGEETIYQTDTEADHTESASCEKVETILIQDDQRAETGLVKQVNPPKYQGAVVLCQGADDPSVKLMIADAVSKITGLGLDKIAVLKMK